MTPAKTTIVNFIVALLLVTAPVQFAAAALHLECGAAPVTMGASDDGEGAGAALQMAAGTDCQQGAHHHCFSCASCCATGDAAPAAAAVDGGVAALAAHRLTAPFLSPSLRPPIVL